MTTATAPVKKTPKAEKNDGLAAAGKRAMRATAAFARERKGESWWVVLSSIALLALALVGTFPLWAWPFRLVSSLLAALLMVRVFVIYHDHQHRAILSKSKAAERLMNVIGVLLLAPPSSWKHSHDAHHAHNSKLHGNDLGSFPTMTRERYRASSWKERLRYRVSRHPLTILCGYLTSFAFAMCLDPFLEDRRRHFDGLISILVHIGLIVSVGFFFGWAGVLFTIVLPFGVASALGLLSVLRPAQLPGRIADGRGRLDLRRRGPRILEFHADAARSPLVHGKHRLPPHPPSERENPLLPPARGLQSPAGSTEGQAHEPRAGGHYPLSSVEGVECRGATPRRLWRGKEFGRLTAPANRNQFP